MALPVIHDGDPGHDDVVATLLAARHTDLRAITTVCGNAAIQHTTANALVARSVIGIDVPVYPGAERPLVRTLRTFPEIHGNSGLAGTSWPGEVAHPSSLSAVEAILELSRVTEGLWVVATGPLTNLALALRSDPDLARRLGGISLMGGGLAFGNVTPAAEYNVWADPEAADIVFSSGVALLVTPLDFTHRVLVDYAFIERVDALGTAGSAFMGDLLRHFTASYREVFFERALGPLHDPCAVLALTNPELFTFEDLHVEVSRSGRARGMLIADRRGVHGSESPNVKVATDGDASAVLDRVFAAIEALGQ